MDFGISADQALLTESLRRVLADVCPLDRVRGFADGGEPYAADVWQGLVDLGLPGLIIDERYGGVGLGMIDAALVVGTLGAHVAPAPFLSSCVVAPFALGIAGTEVMRENWLPRIARGEIRIGLALSEHTGRREDAGVRSAGERLDGRALFVLDAGADVFLVADTSRTLHLIDSNAAGLTRRELVTIDRTRRIGELEFDSVAANPLDPERHDDALQRIIDCARVLIAADSLGAAQHMLDAAVAYAGEREQFGRVIGSFQAVKHLCADMAVSLEPCHAFVWYAAHALDALPDEAHLAACHVKAQLAEVGTAVAKSATEVHGGVGFTDLLGLHYWFKRLGLNRQLFGGPERARHDAAVAQGLSEPDGIWA